MNLQSQNVRLASELGHLHRAGRARRWRGCRAEPPCARSARRKNPARRACPLAHGERVPVHLCVYLARERRRSPGRCVFRPGGASACAGAAKPRTRGARRRAPRTAAPGDARASAGVFVCRVFCPAGFGVRDERWSYCRRAHARVFSAARVFDRGHGVWHRVSASVQLKASRFIIQESAMKISATIVRVLPFLHYFTLIALPRFIMMSLSSLTNNI